MSAKLKEEEIRGRFDAGESLESLGFDLEEAVVEQPQIKRVNVDFPDSVVAKLDRHAAQVGITRQSLIKVWIFERLKQETAKPTHVNPHWVYHLEREESGSAEDLYKRALELVSSRVQVPELESKKRR